MGGLHSCLTQASANATFTDVILFQTSGDRCGATVTTEMYCWKIWLDTGNISFIYLLGLGSVKGGTQLLTSLQQLSLLLCRWTVCPPKNPQPLKPLPKISQRFTTKLDSSEPNEAESFIRNKALYQKKSTQLCCPSLNPVKDVYGQSQKLPTSPIVSQYTWAKYMLGISCCFCASLNTFG